MENKIRKAELSDVLKIGKFDQFKGHAFTKDDFYSKDVDGKKVLHLNKLAWESPSIYTKPDGDEIRGFVPGDPFYNEIIDEFKSFQDRYRAGNTVRKILPNSPYDIIITWVPEVKMVSWIFRESNEYCID